MSAQRKPDARPRSTSAARTRAYRERLRAQGLKPVTVWTYDINDPAFLARVRESSLSLRDNPEENAVLDELEVFQIADGLWD